MKPTNWKQLNYDERQAVARRLYRSDRGRFLMYQGLMTAAVHLRERDEISDAEDLEMIAETLFAFDQPRRSPDEQCGSNNDVEE